MSSAPRSQRPPLPTHARPGRLDAAVNPPGRARGLDHLAEPDCRAVYFAVRHQLPAIAGFGEARS